MVTRLLLHIGLKKAINEERVHLNCPPKFNSPVSVSDFETDALDTSFIRFLEPSSGEGRVKFSLSGSLIPFSPLERMPWRDAVAHYHCTFLISWYASNDSAADEVACGLFPIHQGQSSLNFAPPLSVRIHILSSSLASHRWKEWVKQNGCLVFGGASKIIVRRMIYSFHPLTVCTAVDIQRGVDEIELSTINLQYGAHKYFIWFMIYCSVQITQVPVLCWCTQ